MDVHHPIALAPRSADLVEADLCEIDVAIRLVSAGLARRVCLAGLHWPDLVASTALARAQVASVDFKIDRANGTAALIFGAAD